MPVHECVCFVLLSDNKVLLERREITDRIGDVALNIPGGHMEAGETQRDTLLREVEEELGVIPISCYFLCDQPFVAQEAQLLHYYVVTEWAGEVLAQEAAQVEWHSIESQLALSAADRAALHAMRKGLNNRSLAKADTLSH